MNSMGNKSLILLFTLFFAVILCGSVSATSNVTTGKTISTVSTHTPGSTISHKLIDSGVTYTKGYLVKINNGHYSTNIGQVYNGMKYPTKYYWKTYLYSNGNIAIYTHFYHTTLKRTIYQKVIIGTQMVLMNNHGLYKRMVYETVTPRSWGGSSYWSLTGFLGTPLNFYWHSSVRYHYHSFRYYLIKYAPEGPE